MKILLLLTVSAALTGCGWWSKEVDANITGYSAACISGVTYLQFYSGVTVAYDIDGKIKTCEVKK